jgi:hypothetical protein
MHLQKEGIKVLKSEKLTSAKISPMGKLNSNLDKNCEKSLSD